MIDRVLLHHLEGDNTRHNFSEAGNLLFDEMPNAIGFSTKAIVNNPGSSGYYVEQLLPDCLSMSILLMERFVMVCMWGELALLAAVFRILKLLSRLISSLRVTFRL